MERHLEASTSLHSPLVQVRSVLREHPCVAFSDHATLDERRDNRYKTDVEVQVGGGASVHQEVEIELGPLRSDATSVNIPVRWSATGHTSLFPVFDGAVEVTADDGTCTLKIEGTYRAPLGLLGRVGDRLVGKRAAEATAEAFVRHVAERIDRAADRSAESGPRRPAPYPVDLRMPATENHLG